jgi:acyl-CoA synthetase (AMP-forming)/AMP-acid ligase II
VALAFPTGAEFLVAFLGALRAGAAPAPLPPPSRLGGIADQQRRLGGMLAVSTPQLLLAERALLPLLRETPGAGMLPLGVHALDALPRDHARADAAQAEDLGLVQFSSGTTGAPKAVALSRRALAVQARLLNAFWPERDGIVHAGFSWLPLHHDMGLVGCVLPALERPADLTLLPPEAFVARPGLWLRGISASGATVSAAPTFGYARALRRVRDEELARVDLAGWRVALCGAETVVAETLRAFAGRFARWGFRAEALTAVYGLAEAGLAVTFGALGRGLGSARFDRGALLAGRATPSPQGREVASVGVPVPGFALALRDDSGHEVAVGRVGSVWMRGPSLMAGYLGDPGATARPLRDGWLDSGDLGFLRDGELYLVGRRHDVVVMRGRNHAPEEIEEAAGRVAGVRAGGVAAVGWLPEEAAEEELLLLVERERTRVDGVDALAAACRGAVLAATGLDAARVAVLEPGTLPRTSSGKLRRGEALRRWLAGELLLAPRGEGEAPPAP